MGAAASSHAGGEWVRTKSRWRVVIPARSEQHAVERMIVTKVRQSVMRILKSDQSMQTARCGDAPSARVGTQHLQCSMSALISVPDLKSLGTEYGVDSTLTAVRDRDL